ncbi:hypothetical protein [Corynebacterium aquatimens]|uniref:CopG family transcriptional regulator n=1 Tax=Corynebacterium aquatimens TaxID=1190508 RepID=A0A931E366_9CORY|nr:hypothetical protein [Corynebacterium aquatimens]MBG6122755.1 hypothetical protein [Corynebacterium aquatimens]WJY66908.1 hypothetical protein CAQUA_11125 [Corynebacterium aquatimens]
MRLTVRLDPEIYVAAKELAAEEKISTGEAVNEIARRGLAARPVRKKFTMPTKKVGMKIDCTNVVEVLDYLDRVDGPESEERVS